MSIIREAVAPKDWPEIREWRKTTRVELLAARSALSRRARRHCAAAIATVLARHESTFAGRCVGFYWPMNGEIDLVPFVRGVFRNLAAAALPVIVEKNQPLEFWRWSPRTQLCTRGLWNIPSPTERILVKPDLVLVPLLGFDAAGHRLGNGGGYYDRTWAVIDPKPRLVGIGYELGRLPTIYPQPHDVPMDAVITERRIFEWVHEA